MDTIYITLEGDMADLIAYRHYGATAGAAEAVIEANPVLSLYPAQLPAGLALTLPDWRPQPTPPVRLWS